MAKDKCECRPGIGVLGMVLIVAGIYFLVWGFMIQTNSNLSWSSWSWWAALNYLIGIFLFGFGKIYKHKGYGCCKVHSMHMHHKM
jgi:membrane-bound ClpP family serine protease